MAKRRKLNKAELFADPRFGDQISYSIRKTAMDNKELAFLVAMYQNHILINKPSEGGENTIKVHRPGDGISHPEGCGLHLKEGYHPYFLFHTHSRGVPRPSLRDLLYVYSVARENYILTESDSSWWVNPIGMIVHGEDSSIFQLNYRTIAQIPNEEVFLEKMGGYCVNIGRKIRIRGVVEEDKNNPGRLDEFPEEILLVGIGEKSLVYEFPGFLYEHVDRIYRACGIRIRYFPWEGQESLIKQLAYFSPMPNFRI